jgi:hypothetical protein
MILFFYNKDSIILLRYLSRVPRDFLVDASRSPCGSVPATATRIEFVPENKSLGPQRALALAGVPLGDGHDLCHLLSLRLRYCLI